MLRRLPIVFEILAALVLVGCGSENPGGHDVLGAGGLAAQIDPMGACCLADGTCVFTTAEDCGLQGGIYQGDEIACDPNPCELPPPPPPAEGACCFTDGTCLVLTAEDCGLQGGIYQGDEIACDPNPCAQPEQPEGCGHGYWKNHESEWEPTGYAPEDLVGGIFTIPADLDELADDTLADALAYAGGNGVIGAARILLRHAVAGLLNAAHPEVDYPRSVDEIVSAVNAALASGDRRTILACKEEVDQHNSRGCPLH